MKKLLSEFIDIVSEWHPTKNGDLKPEDFTHASHKLVWWLCPKGHDYDASISDRTSKRRQGCPYCSGKRVSEDNNLKFLFPKVASEWHPTKNGDLKPEDFVRASHKLVWWLCPKGHSYDSLISSRTSKRRQGCPYCSGRRVSKDNNLKLLFPKVASEWHPTKNGDLKPEDFSYASNNKVWWLCPKGHSYDARIPNRTKPSPSSCPFCSNQSSAPELRILTELRFIFNDVKTRYKIEGVEIDIYVPKLNLAIEYDGSYYHQGKEQKDLEKNEFLQLRNIKVVRVRCNPLPKITENDLIVKNDDLSKSDLNSIFKRIHSFCDNEFKQRINNYIDSEHFFNENLFKEYLSYFPSPLPENSLTNKFPNLIGEWDIDKNHPLTPNHYSPGSRKIVWWLCPKGHSYDAQIYSRTGKNKTGCPYCSGNKVSDENNLLHLFPDIASEWHPTKNSDLKPEDFTFGSKKKVWWLCPKGHSYDSTINGRTNKSLGCPFCSGKRVSNENNLKQLFPEIAKEWHPTKNGTLKSEEFTHGSSKKVWWLCPKGHSYDAQISSRTRKNLSGCSYCSGKKVSEDNNLKFLFPEIAKEWHPTKNNDLKPEEFTFGSKKKVWWLCPKGHSYDAQIYSRTGNNKTGCLHCYRKSY